MLLTDDRQTPGLVSCVPGVVPQHCRIKVEVSGQGRAVVDDTAAALTTERTVLRQGLRSGGPVGWVVVAGQPPDRSTSDLNTGWTGCKCSVLPIPSNYGALCSSGFVAGYPAGVCAVDVLQAGPPLPQ